MATRFKSIFADTNTVEVRSIPNELVMIFSTAGGSGSVVVIYRSDWDSLVAEVG